MGEQPAGKTDRLKAGKDNTMKKNHSLTAAEAARYAVDQGLEIHKDSWFVDSHGGTDNAVWQISGKLVRAEFDDNDNDNGDDGKKSVELASWKGVLLPPEFDQSDEADAMSEDLEGLYSSMANEDSFAKAHTFRDKIRNTKGERITENQIELYPVLLLEDLDFTEAGMKRRECDSGLDAFLKLYDNVIGGSEELATAAYLENNEELLEAFTANGWAKLRQTETGYWVVCRVKTMF